MNYSMQGMTKTTPELFMMMKLMKVEIKKEHQVLMVDKTTSFKKRAKGKKGNFKKNGKQVAAQVKKPKSGPKPETKCFYCKGTGHWKRNYPKYLADKKDGKVNKSIFDIHVIDVYFTSVYSNPSVFDTGSVAKSSNSKQELQNKQRLVKGEVTMCVGSSSMIDMIIIAHSPILSGLVLNLNKCYLVFALSMNMI